MPRCCISEAPTLLIPCAMHVRQSHIPIIVLPAALVSSLKVHCTTDLRVLASDCPVMDAIRMLAQCDRTLFPLKIFLQA